MKKGNAPKVPDRLLTVRPHAVKLLGVAVFQTSISLSRENKLTAHLNIERKQNDERGERSKDGMLGKGRRG